MSCTEVSTRIFFHITCINNWRTIVRDHFIKIIFSGLYHYCTQIHCFMVIPKELSTEEAKCFVQQFGTKICIEDTCTLDDAIGKDEWFTLGQIKKYIHEHDRILYIHSKGVTRWDQKDIYSNVEDWRDLMDYFLIYQYKYCLEALQENDAVGINFWNEPPHFSGNYWWCTGKHYLALPDTKGTEEYVLSLMNASLDNHPIICNIYSSPHVGGASYWNSYSFLEYIDADLLRQ